MCPKPPETEPLESPEMGGAPQTVVHFAFGAGEPLHTGVERPVIEVPPQFGDNEIQEPQLPVTFAADGPFKYVEVTLSSVNGAASRPRPQYQPGNPVELQRNPSSGGARFTC